MTISGISTQYNRQMSSASDATSRAEKQEAMFKKIDTNGDGSIDKSEFAAMHENRPAPPDMEMSLEELFAKIDTDGDGKLSQAEMEAMQNNRPMRPEAAADNEDLFAKIDTDGDGTISQDEFAVFDEQMRSQRPAFAESSAAGTTGMTLAQALAEEEDESTTTSPYLRQYQISSLEITRELVNILG